MSENKVIEVSETSESAKSPIDEVLELNDQVLSASDTIKDYCKKRRAAGLICGIAIPNRAAGPCPLATQRGTFLCGNTVMPDYKPCNLGGFKR